MTLVTNLYQRRIPVGPSIHVIRPSRPRSSCHPERRAFRSEAEGSPSRSESRHSRGLHFERETLRLATLAQGDTVGSWLAQGDMVGSWLAQGDMVGSWFAQFDMVVGSLMEHDTQLPFASEVTKPPRAKYPLHHGRKRCPGRPAPREQMVAWASSPRTSMVAWASSPRRINPTVGRMPTAPLEQTVAGCPLHHGNSAHSPSPVQTATHFPIGLTKRE
jgi:hypothetical protein